MLQEYVVAMNNVLDRLPNIRFDPELAAPRIIGLEHHGPSGLPVVFDRQAGTLITKGEERD